MKIAFFSDIHGNIYVLNDFFCKIKKYNVDMIVFCGDVFGYYYHQEDILNIFSQHSNLICIKGNHDKMFLEMLNSNIPESLLTSLYGSSYHHARESISDKNIKYLKTWADEWHYNIDGLNIAAFHGSPQDKLNGRIYPDTVIEDPSIYSSYTHLILGHTHHKMERKINNCFILNPGSIGQQRDGRGCSFLILDTSSKKHTFHTVDYCIQKLEQDIRIFDPGNYKLIEVLYRER